METQLAAKGSGHQRVSYGVFSCGYSPMEGQSVDNQLEAAKRATARITFEGLRKLRKELSGQAESSRMHITRECDVRLEEWAVGVCVKSGQRAVGEQIFSRATSYPSNL